ncbi:hypothetical protein BJX99DRAFT_222628 [Aspergillus californicus]
MRFHCRKYNVAWPSIFMDNANLRDCYTIPEGTELCMPFSCDGIYTLQKATPASPLSWTYI